MFLLFYVCLGLLVIVGFMILKPLQFFVYTYKAKKQWNENLYNDDYDGIWRGTGTDEYYYPPTMERVKPFMMFGRRVCMPIHQFGDTRIVYDEIGNRLRANDERKRKLPIPVGQTVRWYSGCTRNGVNILFQDVTQPDGWNRNALKLIKHRELIYGNIYTDIQTDNLLWVRYVNIDSFNRHNNVLFFVNSNGVLVRVCDCEIERVEKDVALKSLCEKIMQESRQGKITSRFIDNDNSQYKYGTIEEKKKIQSEMKRKSENWMDNLPSCN